MITINSPELVQFYYLSCDFFLKATGGNDGAICIRELTNYRNDCDESECIILPCHEFTTNNTKELMIDSHEMKITSPRSQQVMIFCTSLHY